LQEQGETGECGLAATGQWCALALPQGDGRVPIAPGLARTGQVRRTVAIANAT